MRIKSITPVGKRDVYDISVADVEHYILDNGVASHNTGSYYSADNIFILGRQQEKDGTELLGYNFIINVEKSRHTREKSKIPVTVKFDGGISKWSGLLDMALESKDVVKPSNGWYSRVDPETGEVQPKRYRLKETDTKEFWMPILLSEHFRTWVIDNYQVSSGQLISDEEIDNAIVNDEVEADGVVNNEVELDV